ncbi:MAG: EF-P beta-lysylation protein EpmB [Steroidobacteraceae bacterium]
MIAAQPAGRHTASSTWQRELAEAFSDPVELLAALGLTPEMLDPPQTAGRMRTAAGQFPLRVPRSYAARMRAGDPRDPLLLQVLAQGSELAAAAGYGTDPLEEQAARKAPGLLHKYAGRALLVTTGACAVHCRYCFRRHHDYSADQPEQDLPRWAPALQALQSDPSIEEIILSGGDPLSLANPRLEALLTQLAALPQIRRIRIHTRTPIALPARVDVGLLQLLARVPRELIIVVHANHPRELDADTAAALQKLRQHCRLLLNQSVLLAGVNDDAHTLTALSQRLFECGVLPYYLHQLDHVAGAAHFEVPDSRALALVAQVNASLPGYLVPKLVREVPGAAAKLPVQSSLDPA